MSCTYSNCAFPALPDKKLCLFHAPVDEKGVGEAEFREAIRAENISPRRYDFEGYIFPWPIDFPRNFERPVDFSNAEFHKRANFGNISFHHEAQFDGAKFLDGADFSISKFLDGASFQKASFSGDVDFSGAEFTGGRTIFHQCEFKERSSFPGAKFLGVETDFSGCRFDESANFQNCAFGGGPVYFHNSRFAGGIVNFDGSVFSGNAIFYKTAFLVPYVNFPNIKFLCNSIVFRDVDFGPAETIFRNAIISHAFRFIRCKVSADFDFSEVEFEKDASFHFEKPLFPDTGNSDVMIIFQGVRFNPFLTHFLDIHHHEVSAGLKIINRPTLGFRLCELKEVYFGGSDMSLFSFFQCVFFEEAHFVGCNWGKNKESILGNNRFPRYERQCMINEDLRISQLNSPETLSTDEKPKGVRHSIQFPEGSSDIAELYLRMKSASDRAKDYQRASWFYFNEFEMKRLSYSTKKTADAQEEGGGRNYGRFLLYSAYKLFAGYGEKPLWSFIWFFILTLVFSILHLFNGFTGPNGTVINYDLASNWPSLTDLFANFGRAVVYTLYKVIPISYLPIQRTDIGGAIPTTGDQVLIILNFVVLGTLLVLTGIGLKRHFRRF